MMMSLPFQANDIISDTSANHKSGSWSEPFPRAADLGMKTDHRERESHPIEGVFFLCTRAKEQLNYHPWPLRNHRGSGWGAVASVGVAGELVMHIQTFQRHPLPSGECALRTLESTAHAQLFWMWVSRGGLLLEKGTMFVKGEVATREVRGTGKPFRTGYSKPQRTAPRQPGERQEGLFRQRLNFSAGGLTQGFDAESARGRKGGENGAI